MKAKARPWTPAEDELLRRSQDTRMSMAAYCRIHLPGRSDASARGRLSRLLLGSREALGDEFIGLAPYSGLSAEQKAREGSERLLRAIHAYCEKRRARIEQTSQ